MYVERQRKYNSQNNFLKKNEIGMFTLPDFRTCKQSYSGQENLGRRIVQDGDMGVNLKLTSLCEHINSTATLWNSSL